MAHKLDEHIDEIIQMITDGESQRDIAEKFNVSKGTVGNFLLGHTARASEAYRQSGSAFADKAIEALKDETIDIARSRELASHYRWEAKMRDRAKYGDKVEVEDKRPVFTPDNFETLLDIARKNAVVPGTGE